MPEGTLGVQAVFLVCEWTAGALIFSGIEWLMAGKAWQSGIALFVLAGFFALLGVGWPMLKVRLGARFSRFASGVEHLASDYRYRNLAIIVAILVAASALSLYLHSLRRDLDAHFSTRSISKEQADKLRHYLAQHEAHAVSVKVVQHDQEAMGYAAQLFFALRQTNWDVNPPNHGGPAYWRITNPERRPEPNDVDDRGQRLYKNIGEYMRAHDEWFETELSDKIAEQNYDQTGLCIEVEMNGQPTNPDPRHPTPEAILQDAFRYAGIEVNCSGGSYNRPMYALYLLVGHIARPLGGQPESVLSRFGRWIASLGQTR